MALSIVLPALLLCAVVGPVRRFLAVWSWVALVRHRLRLCFTRIVRGSGGVRPGSLPLILCARPTPAGERVWLWLRPGLALEDLDGAAHEATDVIAVTVLLSVLAHGLTATPFATRYGRTQSTRSSVPR